MICQYRCPTINGVDLVSCENNFDSAESCICADGYVLDEDDNCILREHCPIFRQEEARLPRETNVHCKGSNCAEATKPYNQHHIYICLNSSL